MTDLPAATISLEIALLRLHPVSSPFQRIREALGASPSRNGTRRGYRYLRDHTDSSDNFNVLGTGATPLRAALIPHSRPSATYPSL
jgi:hypothetical protein